MFFAYKISAGRKQIHKKKKNPSFQFKQYLVHNMYSMGFLGDASGKKPTCQCRRHKRHRFNPWVRKIPLEEDMETHSSILAWRTPWTEEPGGLQSIESHRVRHD